MISTQKLFEAIASEICERIREDREEAPPSVGTLLKYLEDHLFDPDLDGNQLKRACGIRDNSVPLQFHKAVGLPPYAYIENRRMQVASRMLRESDCKIWQIAQMLGYSTMQVFSRAFGRWSGLRPSAYRKQEMGRPSEAASREDGVVGRRLALGSGEVEVSLALLRRAIGGALDTDEAKALVAHLHHLYSLEQEPAVPGIPGTPTRCRAEEVWQMVRDLPPTEARQRLQHVDCAGPDLFDFLHRKSREHGRANLQRGLEIAELALASTEALEPGSQREVLMARAYAWIGNARRLAADLDGAEAAHRKARRLLPPNAPILVHAEILFLEANLRWYQRRLSEASALGSRVIEILRGSEDAHCQLAEALILRATLYEAIGEPEKGIPDLLEALPLAEQTGLPYLRLSAYHNLATALASAERFREAAALLPRISVLCHDLDQEPLHLHRKWLEGVIAVGTGNLHKAEKLLVETHQRFLDGPRHGHAALVALDLCSLYLQQGRSEEVMVLAIEAVTFFDSLKIHREAAAGLAMLQQAIAAKEVTEPVLKKARGVLQALQRNPSVKF